MLCHGGGILCWRRPIDTPVAGDPKWMKGWSHLHHRRVDPRRTAVCSRKTSVPNRDEPVCWSVATFALMKKLERSEEHPLGKEDGANGHADEDERARPAGLEPSMK